MCMQVDENFLAAYHSSYGVAEPDTTASSSGVDPSVKVIMMSQHSVMYICVVRSVCNVVFFKGSSAGVPTSDDKQSEVPIKRDVPDTERDDVS